MTHAAASADRRLRRGDRRRNPRGGRRPRERRAKVQRVAWLVAAYGIYLTMRAVPAAFRRMFRRRSS